MASRRSQVILLLLHTGGILHPLVWTLRVCMLIPLAAKKDSLLEFELFNALFAANNIRHGYEVEVKNITNASNAHSRAAFLDYFAEK